MSDFLSSNRISSWSASIRPWNNRIYYGELIKKLIKKTFDNFETSYSKLWWAICHLLRYPINAAHAAYRYYMTASSVQHHRQKCLYRLKSKSSYQLKYIFASLSFSLSLGFSSLPLIKQCFNNLEKLTSMTNRFNPKVLIMIV
jgi:hypothetical protein